VTASHGLLVLEGNDTRPDIVLAPLEATHKVQWDIVSRASWPMTPDEADAYERLSALVAGTAEGAAVEATGPLKKNGDEYYLEVRSFSV
ncbi:MAG TPA: hypothetical protein VME17_09235, partial [Bryobacteraceae bacterium]|nr:hypothetical protein [Bryobacteraceae bacterium]